MPYAMAKASLDPKLREAITQAAISAVNATLYRIEEHSQERAPIRSVFIGGRKTIRLKTKAEVASEKQGRLAVMPPIYSQYPGGPQHSYKAARAGTQAQVAYLNKQYGPSRGLHGFPRTVEHLDRTKTARASRSAGFHVQVTTNRLGGKQNAYIPIHRIGGRNIEGSREISTGTLASQVSLSQLSTRGRYELRSGRAIIGSRNSGELGGALRRSIHVIPAVAKGNRVVGYVVAGGADAPYAKYQEFGTRHNAAHPFLRPSLHAEEGTLRKQVAKQMLQLNRAVAHGERQGARVTLAQMGGGALMQGTPAPALGSRGG